MEKIKSIKYNFIFNFIRVFSGILFPMLTVPYLSRVLQPEGIGKIAFADSIIQYFVLIASLGIPIYGIREIAKARDNKEELSKTLSELFLINILMTLLAYIVFIFLYLFVEKIQKESLLFFVMSFNIIFSTLGIEWYYQGIEKYDYITIRSILVRVVSVILMFLLVKTKQDYIISATIGVVGNVGSNLYNIYGARKFINIKKEYFKEIKRHIKAILTTFAMVLISSVFIQATYIVLGFLKNEEALGYFATATKIYQILTMLIVSLGAVMIPRLSILVKNNEKEKYNILITKLLVFNIAISLPIIIILSIFSNEFIKILFGEKFLKASWTMIIIILTLPVSSTINILGQQILYPNNEEKKIVYSFIVGAVVSFISNFILISRYSYFGAAIASVFTQSTVLIIQYYFAKNYIKINFFKTLYKVFLSNVLLLFIIILTKRIAVSILMLLLLNAGYIIIYILTLFLLREEYIIRDIEKNIIKIVKNINKKLKGKNINA